MSALGARIWPWVPAGLLACMLGGLGTLASIATRDPGFALERDYYKKAVAFDREIAQRSENARLGWSIEAHVGTSNGAGERELVVGVRDATGPVSGARVELEALRNANASNLLEAVLAERTPGVYAARLPLRPGGLWEFRLTLVRGSDRFTAVERLEVREYGR